MLTIEEKREYFELLEQQEIIKIKNDAWEFCMYYLPDFFSKREFLKPIAYLIQWLVEREFTPRYVIEYVINSDYLEYYNNDITINKASISMPPRSGKSLTCSVCVAWLLGKYSSECVMRNTCTSTLYRKFSYDTRDIIRSIEYQKIFNAKLSPDKQNVDGWDLTESKQGAYFGSGVGGTIIGFGASLIAITDDLYSNIDEALSETINDKKHRWKESTHDSRIEKHCPVLDIGTRWSKKDIIGTNIKENKYDVVLKITALTEKSKSFCEDVKTTDEYIGIKKNIDPMIWEAEYQQAPIEAKGTVFQLSKLKRFTLSELNKGIDSTVISAIDTADGGTDFYCHIDSLKIGNKIYIIDVIFNKEKLTTNQILTNANLKKNKSQNLILEINKEGSLYINEVGNANPDTSVYGKYNTANKITRILVQSGWVLENCYFRSDYESGSDYDLFITNLISFVKEGGNKNDDAPDSIALLAWYIRNILS